jgi:hypothetical protein
MIAGWSHPIENSVIPTVAERGEAKWRDLFCCFGDKRSSLDYAARRAASPLRCRLQKPVVAGTSR